MAEFEFLRLRWHDVVVLAVAGGFLIIHLARRGRRK
jgi:hypothetical protein